MIKPKVSVIIPVYNTENFLAKCLDSVCSQKLRDIEIICINDYSADASLDILENYAKRDSRIKIINFEKNCGVSAARNAGIKAAKGEYIGFVDSDDWISPDFYERLYELSSEDVDIIKGDVKYLDEKNFFGEFSKDCFSDNQKIRENKGNFLFYFWTAIYKREVIDLYNILFYEDLQYAEDLCFVSKAVACCNRVECVDDVFYYYANNEQSAMHSVQTKYSEYENSCILATERLLTDISIERNDLSVYDAQFQRIFIWIIIYSRNYKFDQEEGNRRTNKALENYKGQRDIKEIYSSAIKEYNVMQRGIFTLLRGKLGIL